MRFERLFKVEVKEEFIGGWTTIFASEDYNEAFHKFKKIMDNGVYVVRLTTPEKY